MTTVNTHEAKTQLSRLLALVEQGEEVIIARNGKPIAKLVPAVVERPQRRLGTLAGKITITPEFFEPLSNEELAGWFRAMPEPGAQ